MKKKRKKLVLLDAHAIIHRAYHGMPDFSTRAGFPTGAIYGFISMVLKIIEDFHPDYIVAAYDRQEATFRHEAFAEYKGKRSKTDESLKMQFGPTREICEIFSIPIYDYPGFEADDIIGTIAEQLKNDAVDIIIASGDMDTLQLVEGKRVQVFTLKRGIKDTVIYDEEAVKERFGFIPPLIVDYKALRGDPSDNIPGIRGIGDKAATLLVSQFGTIEKIYETLEKKGEEIFLQKGVSKRMLKLLVEGREDAEFSKILAEIRKDAPIHFQFPQDNWRKSIDVEKALKLFEKYELRALPKRLFKTLEIEQNAERTSSVSLEKKIDGDRLKLAAIALQLLDSDEVNASLEEILRFTQKKTFEEAEKYLFEELQKEGRSYKVFQEIEKPLLPIVKKMEANGILLDRDFFINLSENYHQKLNDLEEKIFHISGEKFNINSPKQLSEVLFEKMQLPTKGIKKSKSGAYSTNIDNLEKLEDKNEVIRYIIQYRELQKLLSTYIDTLPSFIQADGRIHAEFIQNGTATGRFSSQNPNLQNIPVKSEIGREMRKGFIAGKGKKLVSFDYSQIELRILAFLSGDEKLKDIFRAGKDIHSSVAALIAGVDEQDVDQEMRRKAKVVNFGILYGMGISALKKEMQTTREEAQKFYQGFFTQFPQATAFLEKTKQFAREHGYTETLFGRRRYFKSINAKLPFIRAMAERMALNAPIQGTAADIIKLAMILGEQELHPEQRYGAKLILQIHDELIYELDENNEMAFVQDMKKLMEKVLEKSYEKIETDIPFSVHYSSGKNWGDLK